VLDTAAQRPAPTDAVATIDHDRLAIGSEGASADDVRIAAIDCARRWLGQAAGEEAVEPTDHHAPAGGAVGARDLFHNPHEGRRIGLRPSVAAGDQQPKEAVLRQGRDDWLRQAALLLDLFTMRLDDGH
jgi:hypothetical protein